MGRGSADETVVVVKMGAGEGAVTYPRVKLPSSDPVKSGLEAKGETCYRDFMFRYKLSFGDQLLREQFRS